MTKLHPPLVGSTTAVLLALLTVAAHAVDFDNDSGDSDWNTATNWDNGIPTGADSAAIGDGVTGITAGVSSAPPIYSGSLTINSGSTLRFYQQNNVPDIFRALGGGPITMRANSTIDTATQTDPHFPAIVLAGDAKFVNTTNWADWDSRYFDGEITAAGEHRGHRQPRLLEGRNPQG